MSGIEDRLLLLDGGASAEQVAEWETSTRQTLLRGGAKPEDVAAYFGDPGPADTERAAAVIGGAVDTLNEKQRERASKGPMEALEAGWQMGGTGLTLNKPFLTVPEDASFGEKTLSALGTMAGDMPLMLPAAATGGAAGFAVGGPAGAAIGAGAAMAIVPYIYREEMMYQYENPDGPETAADYFRHVLDVQWGALREGIVGGVSMALGVKAGAAAAGALAPVVGSTASKIAGGVTNVVTFTAAATGLHASFEGKVPDAEDFMIGAILALGFTAAGHTVGAARRFVPNKRAETVADNLRRIYEETGLPPKDVMEAARMDTVLQGEMFAPRNAQGEKRTPTLDEMKLEDPKNPNPYEPEINAKTIEGEFKVLKEPAPKEGDTAAKTEREAVQERFDKIEEFRTMIVGLERTEAFAKRKGISPDEVVSSAGAIGVHQIMPGTARQYGFDPKRLFDPEYNKDVAETIIADLAKRYNGDPALIAIAYNGGPGRANAYIRAGRDPKVLPRETQDYLRRAELAGKIDEGIIWSDLDAQLALQNGGGGNWAPPPRGPRSDPGIQEPGRQPRKVETDVLRLSEDQLIDRTLGMVETPEPLTAGQKIVDASTRVRRVFDFQFSSGRRLDRSIEDSLGERSPNALTIEDMMRQTLASRERGYAFIHEGGVDPITMKQINKKSLKAALVAVREDGGSIEGFQAFLFNSRAVEKAGQGIDTGFDTTIAKRFIGMPGVKAKYARAAKAYAEAKDGVVDYMVQSGSLSIKGGQAMKELNRFHIVHRRVMDPAYEAVDPNHRFGQGGGVVKKMKGSKRKVTDPWVADIDNVYTMVSMADHNRAVGDIIGRIEAVNKSLPPERRIEFERREDLASVIDTKTGKILESKWTDELGNPLEGRAKEAAEWLFAQEKVRAGLGPNDFVYYREGKRESWRAKDPDLAALVRHVWPGKVNIFAALAIKSAGLVRLGVTSMLDFQARTLFQSNVGAAVMSKAGSHIPFVNFGKGFFEVIGKTDLYKEWRLKGGAGATLVEMDMNIVMSDFIRLHRGDKALDMVWNSTKHPINAVRMLGASLEAMPRVGIYKVEVAKGVPKMKAAMRSRKGMLDFGERFNEPWVQTWGRMVAFMAPGFKDAQQFNQRVIDPLRRGGKKGAKQVGKLALIGGASMTTTTLLNFALNMAADQTLPDGEKYFDQPRWMRHAFWVAPPLPNGERLKLRRPFLPAVPFALVPEMILEWMVTGDPHFDDFWKSVIDMALPPIIPNLGIPFFEDRFEQSISVDRPLIPGYLEEASGHMQYTPDTTETAKLITNILGPMNLNIVDASPIIMENYIRQWGGTLPMALLKVLEKPWHDPIRPGEWADIPIVGNFFARHPIGGQKVSDFYTKYDAVKEARANLRLAIERGDETEIEFSARDERAFLRLEGVTEALSNMRAYVRALALDDTPMTDEEKIKRVDEMSYGMVATAKAGLEIINSINIDKSSPLEILITKGRAAVGLDR